MPERKYFVITRPAPLPDIAEMYYGEIVPERGENRVFFETFEAAESFRSSAGGAFQFVSKTFGPG